jgi:hypothetical protein
MMKWFWQTTVVVMLGAGLVMSCGEQMRQTQEAAKALSSMAENAPKVEDLSQQIEKRQAERRAKGDTLALPYEKLLEYLPTSIADYRAEGDPEGSTTSFWGFSLSNAKRTYRSSNGSELTIELIDYNSNPAGIGLAALGVFMNISIDNAEERSRTFDPGLPVSGAWESFKKKSNDATVMYVLGGRFLLQLQATNQQNTDRVKSIAQQLNLRALASM